jgi:hypothetical protein
MPGDVCWNVSEKKFVLSVPAIVEVDAAVVAGVGGWCAVRSGFTSDEEYGKDARECDSEAYEG